MAVVWIPSLMRDLTGGQAEVSVAGRTVGELIATLDATYPGFKARLCQGERLNPLLTVVVDGQRSRLALQQPVGPQSQVHFLPAAGGG
jgi:molybdopterin synthase sulfur carrier subunit